MDSTLRALSAQANSGGNSGAPEPLLAMLSSLSRNVQLNRGVESAMPSAHATSASAFSAEAKAGESSTEADSPLSLFRQDAVPAMTLFQATSGKGDKSLANATRDELVDALGRRALQDAPAEALLDALAAKSDQELQSIQERIQALLSRISGPIKGPRAMKQTEFMESSAGQADFLLAGATTQHKTAVRSEEESPLLYLLDDRLLARLWPRTRLMVGIRSSRRLRVVLTAASSFALVVTAVESCAGEKEESPAKTAEMRASWLATLGGDVEMSARTASDAQQLLSVLGSQVCGNRMKMKTLRLSGCKMGVKAGEQLATSRACLAELECLGLRGNGLWAGVANDGSGVPALLRDYCGRLRTLELGGNGLDDAGAASLAEALSQMQTLTSLDLSDGKLSSTGASLLAEALAKLSELRCLEIKHNWVADVGTTAICDAIIGQNALNRQSGISSAQTRTVPPLCEVAALNLCTRVELDFRRNGLGPPAALALAKLVRTAPSLRVLKAGENWIGNEGATSLASALGAGANTRGLDTLDLHSNEIGAEGAGELAAALTRSSGVGYAALRVLLLGNNALGASGTAAVMDSALKNCPVLKELDLSSNRAGEDGAEKIVELLACSIDNSSTVFSEKVVCKSSAGRMGRIRIDLRLNRIPAKACEKLEALVSGALHVSVESLDLRGNS